MQPGVVEMGGEGGQATKLAAMAEEEGQTETGGRDVRSDQAVYDRPAVFCGVDEGQATEGQKVQKAFEAKTEARTRTKSEE